MSQIVDHNGRPIVAAPQPRKRATINSHYRGTESNRFRTSLPYIAADINQTLNRGTRRRLMAFSRWLYANHGMVRGAVNDVARYALGTGLTPQSQSAEAKAYEDYFAEWSKVCDVAGQFTFAQMQRMASIRMDVDGDIGFLMIGRQDAFPQLQLIESHNIASESLKYNEAGHDGVMVSPSGKPTAYNVKSGDEFRSISANNFILVYDPDRVAQLRGVSALAHAIDHIRDATDILEFEKVGVKMNSAIGMAITTQGGIADDGSSLIEDGYSAADTGIVAWDTFQPGMVPRLKIGESIESFASNKPSAAFAGFLEYLLRDVALGLGVPYEFIVEPSKQGTASRFILEKAARRFEERQALITSRFCNRVWGWVIARGIKRGDLPASSDWWRVNWQAPKKITVDLGRESKANQDAIKMGLRTMREDTGERGHDWQDIRNQVEREASDLLERAKRLSETYEIKMDTALHLLSQRTPNPVFDNDSETDA